ncbi:hypothetical protein Dimus_002381 [Dionaea muscipula]
MNEDKHMTHSRSAALLSQLCIGGVTRDLRFILSADEKNHHPPPSSPPLSLPCVPFSPLSTSEISSHLLFLVSTPSVVPPLADISFALYLYLSVQLISRVSSESTRATCTVIRGTEMERE